MNTYGHKGKAGNMRFLKRVLRAGCAMIIIGLPAGSTAMTEDTGTSRETRTETTVGIANDNLAMAFDVHSGALVSLRNLATGDEYLKDAGAEGNPFRVWTGMTEPFQLRASQAHHHILEAAPEPSGGEPIEPANCRLVDRSFERVPGAGVLRTVLHHSTSKLRFELQVRLPDEDIAADCMLTVRNDGDQAKSIMTAFPYLNGLRLGVQRESNLAVRLDQTGAANQPAWVDTGGIYGTRQMSMQWQAVYEPTKDEGLGLIVMDPNIRNKMIRRFPPAGMSVSYFPPQTLNPGEEHRYPAVRLLVHRGDWRVTARQYRSWFEKSFNFRKLPRWLDEVDLYYGPHIPKPKVVAEAKLHPETPEVFTSFRKFPLLYLDEQYDLKEWAMYNNLLLKDEYQHPKPEWDYWADGTYYPREDLGGDEALQEGMDRVHKMGQRVHFYVAGYSVCRDSELADRGVFPRWELMDAPGHTLDWLSGIAYMCPGSEGWQDQLAKVARQLVSLGADGIRLDEHGLNFMPCYNPAHNHKSPWNWNTWMRQALRKVREAMDEVNPQASLWTEHAVDFYRENCDAALAQFSPGRDLAPMRMAVPDYRIYNYGTRSSAGATESALNGWISTHPEACIDGPLLRWHELHATFREALLYGDPTNIDPRAPSNPDWVGRLWRTPHYWLLVGGHLDASALKGPTRVNLPQLPDQVQYAYEFDAATLNMQEAQLARTQHGIYLTVESGFGAVLLPLPDCPPLIQPSKLSSLRPAGQAQVALSAFAPWRDSPPEVTVTVAAPGLEVAAPSKRTLPASVLVKVQEDALPGNYFVKVSGNCLPIKRWVQVAP